MDIKLFLKMFLITGGSMFVANQVAAMHPLLRRIIKNQVAAEKIATAAPVDENAWFTI